MRVFKNSKLFFRVSIVPKYFFKIFKNSKIFFRVTKIKKFRENWDILSGHLVVTSLSFSWLRIRNVTWWSFYVVWNSSPKNEALRNWPWTLILRLGFLLRGSWGPIHDAIPEQCFHVLSFRSSWKKKKKYILINRVMT